MTGELKRGRETHWTVEEAEDLIRQLEGVISARIVVDPRGQVEEIHLVTTREVTPKKTVRNVESALRAQFDLSVDHRKVSVAQTHGTQAAPKETATQAATRAEPTQPQPTPSPPVNQGVIESPWGEPAKQARRGPRLVFVRHRQERARSKKVRMAVDLEWNDQTYEGSADALDLPKQRMEATAEATLAAVRSVLQDAGASITFDLDGVEVIQALDHQYALVSVHGFVDGRFSPLTGVVSVAEDPEQAVILATLRATERPVRIVLGAAADDDDAQTLREEETPEARDPLRLWGGGS